MKTMVSGFVADIRYSKRNIFLEEKEIRKILVNEFPDFIDSTKDHIRYKKIESDSYCSVFLDKIVYYENVPFSSFQSTSRKYIEDLLNIIKAQDEIVKMAIRFKLGWETKSIQHTVNIIGKNLLNIPVYFGNVINGAKIDLSCDFGDYNLSLEIQPVEHKEIKLSGDIVKDIILLSSDCTIQKEGSLRFSDYSFLLNKIDMTLNNQILPMIERAFNNEQSNESSFE